MHPQRLFLLYVAFNSGKRYWDCKLSCIEAQIELSSTFVYDHKMRTRKEHKELLRNSHLSQWGRMTIMPMPVNRSVWSCIVEQNIIVMKKYNSFIEGRSDKNFRVVNYSRAVFCDNFILHCDVIRSGMGIIVVRPPGWGANSSQNCHTCSFCSHK